MTSSNQTAILVAVTNPAAGSLLQRVLAPLDFAVTVISKIDEGREYLRAHTPGLMLIGERLEDVSGLEFYTEISRLNPVIPAVLMAERETPELIKAALRAGFADYVVLPLRIDELVRAVQQCVVKSQARKEWIILESRRATNSLRRRLDELETLTRLGRTITSTLDLDQVLLAIVDAAVSLTGAEEGSLLLLDESTGELYMRAQKNFDDAFARAFRMPIRDTLLGSVLRTGQPVLLDAKSPQKIKTSYLVQSLLLVPLQVKGHVFGILGVDNQVKRDTFKEHDQKILTALAEYAVVALENASLYTSTTQERNKVETVITHIEDGVLVVDHDKRLVIVNDTARIAFHLNGQNVVGKRFQEVFSDQELIRMVEAHNTSLNNRAEVTMPDGRVFSARVSEVPDVGVAITMHDITYLKKLDSIKSEFVSTVSHDLRSPLTAIMGYVELIERAGPVNDRQKDFIRRVHANVMNITSLMDELLNLGRIESGFDANKESVYLTQIIEFSVDNCQKQLDAKQQTLECSLADNIPAILANPVQIRRLIDNLIENAIKYTPDGGTIKVSAKMELDQLILQVRDNGLGIPAVDVPYVFDKFYRGSNVAMELEGSGLGLAIVKSIVDNHSGRVWVESQMNSGTVFTVVLPRGFSD